MHLVNIKNDCDEDTLLVSVNPHPTCHKGTDTCWKGDNSQRFGFLSSLENVIQNQKNNLAKKSYRATYLSRTAFN